jgi:hypothetical protein
MPKSIEMERVESFAKSIYNSLELLDTKRLQTSSVHIIHEEGTNLFFRYSYFIRYHDDQHGDWGDCENPGDWIIIFTEHHGFHVYPVDDLILFKELKEV